MEMTYYDLEEKKKNQANTGGKLFWKPNRLLHKLYLLHYYDSTTNLSHLLQKEVIGWFKNLGVIQPH